MSIQKQTVFKCDIVGCEGEMVENHTENTAVVDDGWIVMRDYALLPDDKDAVVCICPLHNIRLKVRR